MILPRPADAIHKAHLARLLMGMLDNPLLSRVLLFKGGTAASLAGWLDRFSLDLDFDLAANADQEKVKTALRNLCADRGFAIKQGRGLFLVLQYPARAGERNSIKVSVMTAVARANLYTPVYLSDIQRYALCQTRDTMVANKLVAPIDRYEKYRSVAGRDIYDIHYFLLRGYSFREQVIRERRKKSANAYLGELIAYIDRRVTDRAIAEDLNFLLPATKFQAMRHTLKAETLMLLGDARERIREASRTG